MIAAELLCFDYSGWLVPASLFSKRRFCATAILIGAARLFPAGAERCLRTGEGAVELAAPLIPGCRCGCQGAACEDANARQHRLQWFAEHGGLPSKVHVWHRLYGAGAAAFFFGGN